MILERIGIIGNIQGVNESKIPYPKNFIKDSKNFESLNSLAMVSCSDSSDAALVFDASLESSFKIRIIL